MDDTDEKAARARLRRLGYEAFCVTHERAWRSLARVRIGNRVDADLVVDVMKVHLCREWDHVLRQPVPAAYAWRLMNEHLAEWTSQDEPVQVQITEFRAVVAAFAGRAGDSLRDTAEQIGLYSAILDLPDRQRDAVILHYVLDLDEMRIAEYWGRPAGTVRSNLRHARLGLAKRLGIPRFPGVPGPERGEQQQEHR